MQMYRFPVYFGWDLFGKVDRVPGRFHVATEFFHVWFLPVAPHRSFMVLEGEGTARGVSVVPIANSHKSLLVVWGRLLLWPLCVLGCVGTILCVVGLGRVLAEGTAVGPVGWAALAGLPACLVLWSV